MKNLIIILFIALIVTSCYKKKHNVLKADFVINNTTFSVNDTIIIIDKSVGSNYIEYNFGDDYVKTGSPQSVFKHKYSSTGNYDITAKIYEHTGGLHPHKSKSNVLSKTITIN